MAIAEAVRVATPAVTLDAVTEDKEKATEVVAEEVHVTTLVVASAELVDPAPVQEAAPAEAAVEVAPETAPAASSEELVDSAPKISAAPEVEVTTPEAVMKAAHKARGAVEQVSEAAPVKVDAELLLKLHREPPLKLQQKLHQPRLLLKLPQLKLPQRSW